MPCPTYNSRTFNESDGSPEPHLPTRALQEIRHDMVFEAEESWLKNVKGCEFCFSVGA